MSQHLIDDLWHNIWVTRVTLDAMQKRLERGEYKIFLEHAATMIMGWQVVGDTVFNELLSKREQEEVVSKEAQCELEGLAVRYLQELRGGDAYQ